jgi:hypothetical protein
MSAGSEGICAQTRADAELSCKPGGDDGSAEYDAERAANRCLDSSGVCLIGTYLTIRLLSACLSLFTPPTLARLTMIGRLGLHGAHRRRNGYPRRSQSRTKGTFGSHHFYESSN